MNTYETIFISTPNLSEDEERSTVEALQSVITERGGSLHIAERMGRRRLAYAIRKFDDGVYTRLLYDSDSATANELERRMRLSDRVLRALTVRLEKRWAQDSKDQAVRILERQAEEAARAEEEAKKAAEAPAAEEAGPTEGSSAEPAKDVASPAGPSADAPETETAS